MPPAKKATKATKKRTSTATGGTAAKKSSTAKKQASTNSRASRSRKPNPKQQLDESEEEVYTLTTAEILDGPAKPAKPNFGLTKQGAPRKTARRHDTNREYGNIKVCGARLRGKIAREQGKLNEPCGNVAGFGTTHHGWGLCKYHGGNTPSGMAAAEREMVIERMREEGGALYGAAIDIGPHEALLQEVQRTAGHVAWLGQMISNEETVDDLAQYTGKDGSKPGFLMQMYQEERKMLVNVCNVAIRAGIAERHIKIAEDQGKLIAGLLMTFINDDQLALTPSQRIFAPKLARKLLLELEGPTASANQVLQGVALTRQPEPQTAEVIDVDPIDN